MDKICQYAAPSPGAPHCKSGPCQAKTEGEKALAQSQGLLKDAATDVFNVNIGSTGPPAECDQQFMGRYPHGRTDGILFKRVQRRARAQVFCPASDPQ